MIRALVQKMLDGVLLTDGITSHHLRRVEIDTISAGDKTISINNDEYVVFRIVSNRPLVYGDGLAKIDQYYIDINYYYAYNKNDARYKAAEKRIKAIKTAFLQDKHFRLVNGQNDLYDLDNPYRGINIELMYLEAPNGK